MTDERHSSGMSRDEPIGLSRWRSLPAGTLPVVALVLAMSTLTDHRNRRAPAAPDPAIQPFASIVRANLGRAEAEVRRPTLRVSSGDHRAALQSCIDQAMAMVERGDTVNAKLAYQDALRLARDDPGALEAVRKATQRFGGLLRSQERLDPVRDAFDNGDFRTALSLLYRLPAEFRSSEAERLKAQGWYNLAVVALRAGNCDEAFADLAEAAALNPDLPGLSGLKVLAAHCTAMAKDSRYFGITDRIGFVGVHSPTSSSSLPK